MAPLLESLLLPHSSQVVELVNRALGKLVERIKRGFGTQIELWRLEGSAEGGSRGVTCRAFAGAVTGMQVSTVSAVCIYLQHPLGPGVLFIAGQFVLILLVLAVEVPHEVHW